jgi:hypothetical protein
MPAELTLHLADIVREEQKIPADPRTRGSTLDYIGLSCVGLTSATFVGCGVAFQVTPLLIIGSLGLVSTSILTICVRVIG